MHFMFGSHKLFPMYVKKVIYLEGTLNVIFVTYVCQTTNLGGGGGGINFLDLYSPHLIIII
jgi:hypothetical protein